MGALLASTRRHLPAELNFITIHYCYFIVVCLLGSAVFWASSRPRGQIGYVDSLFVVVSAMTEAGLNTVNLSTMTTWQQTMLFLLIIAGSTIWVSIWTVVARKLVFHRRFMRVKRACVRQQSVHGSSSSRQVGTTTDQGPPSPRLHSTLPEGNAGSAAAAEAEQAQPRMCDSPSTLGQAAPMSPEGQEEGLAGGAKSGRVCSCEYRALELLSIVVPLYFVLWQLLGCLALGAWMRGNMPDTALANGIDPWWLGVFNGVSAFNNSGMSLLDANMMPFQGAYFVLITMGLMILAGNTAYPIFLRFILWSGLRLLDWTTEAASFRSTKLAGRLLLKDPRRIYTNLFPSRLTWWLLFMLVCLNTADWVLFEVLNLHNPVVGSIPVGPRILVGLFQALAVRSGGFYVVPIAQISIGVQFLYVIMMYIAVYPVVITIRQSNVYRDDLFHDEPGTVSRDYSYPPSPGRPSVLHPSEKDGLATGHETLPTLTAPTEQSWRRRLSHSATAMTDAESMRLNTASQGDVRSREKRPSFHTRPFSSHGASPHATYDSHMSFIHQQLHGQLANDIWLLVLAVLVIVIIESNHFNADPVNFSVFNIIFEVVSAYGTVGISVGTPIAAYSFSGTWYAGSKLVLCLVMLRGRHRGLPTALDHAIRLPGRHLNWRQDDIKDK